MKWIVGGLVVFCALNNAALQCVDKFKQSEPIVINNQSDLDDRLERPCTAANPLPKEDGSSSSRNITIEMNAKNDYVLDMAKFVCAVNLMDGDLLTIRGTGGIVNICSSASLHHTTFDANLRNDSLSCDFTITCDGVVFTRYPVSLRIENVAAVTVENCVFR